MIDLDFPVENLKLTEGLVVFVFVHMSRVAVLRRVSQPCNEPFTKLCLHADK